MSDRALDMRFGLNTKSGLRRFLHGLKYYKVANGVYRHVKVAFACELSYHISYYFSYRVYLTEPVFSFSTN